MWLTLTLRTLANKHKGSIVCFAHSNIHTNRDKHLFNIIFDQTNTLLLLQTDNHIKEEKLHSGFTGFLNKVTVNFQVQESLIQSVKC